MEKGESAMAGQGHNNSVLQKSKLIFIKRRRLLIISELISKTVLFRPQQVLRLGVNVKSA